jgi:starch synthase
LPRYRSIDPQKHALAKWLRKVEVSVGNERFQVGFFEAQPPGSRHRVFFIECAELYDRDGIYGSPSSGDFWDNGRRFVLMCKAALELCKATDWQPDVVHAHDWQAGPAMLFARSAFPSAKRVFTVHNLAYRGLFPRSAVQDLGLPDDLNHPDGYEFYGDVSFLKAGLAAADLVTTVSPTYAREILEPDLGEGLDGFLRYRVRKLVGILNGADYAMWSPQHNAHLPAHFGPGDMSGKRVCKRELQREVGLAVRSEAALCGVVSRLSGQKGIDLILQALPPVLERDAQLVVLGSGDSAIEGTLEGLARRHRGKVAVRLGFDESLAHRIYAGSDLFLMPSRFEPCGLSQLYALRNATPPVVHGTGGLDDTVVDFDARSASGTGFKFRTSNAQALGDAWRRALMSFVQTPEFHGLQKRAMAQDFSWQRAAERYRAQYSALSSST